MLLTQVCLLSCPFCADLGSQVSETEREDLEESEKIQYWVERLCQTRLEQISSADNEISEVTEPLFPHGPSCCLQNHPPWGERKAGWPLASFTVQGCLPAHSPFLPGEGGCICISGLLSRVTSKSQFIWDDPITLALA